MQNPLPLPHEINPIINPQIQKMKTKNLLFTLFLLTMPFVASAYDFEVDGIYYNILSDNNFTCEVTNSGNYGGKYAGDIVIPATVTYNNNTYTVIAIGNKAFEYASGLISITIPDGVTSIGQLAFYGCIGLKSIDIFAPITIIEEETFRYCESLISLKLPETLQKIEREAFRDCTNLQSLVIPASVTTIGYGALGYCESLKELYCAPTTPPVCGDYLCSDYIPLPTLYVPQGCKSVYQAADVWCDFSLEEYDFTGVNDVKTQKMTVACTDNNIVVGGVEGEMVEVYDMQGALVYRGIDTTISLPTHGAYIVRVGNNTQKVVL